MKRFLALALILTLFCTTAFAAGTKEEKQTMDDVVTYAKSVAAMIAYTADDPVSGAVEEVEIGGKKVKVHSEFKYAMDVYYAFYKDYFECLGSMDLSSLTKMATVADAEKRERYLASFDGGAMSSGSHTVVGTMLVRTSSKLSASDQKKLEEEIIAALTAEETPVVDKSSMARNCGQ